MWTEFFSGEHLVLWKRKSSRGNAYIATSPHLRPGIIAQGHHTPADAVKEFILWTEDPKITESWHEFRRRVGEPFVPNPGN
jgi:hypothetical protein